MRDTKSLLVKKESGQCGHQQLLHSLQQHCHTHNPRSLIKQAWTPLSLSQGLGAWREGKILPFLLREEELLQITRTMDNFDGKTNAQMKDGRVSTDASQRRFVQLAAVWIKVPFPPHGIGNQILKSNVVYTCEEDRNLGTDTITSGSGVVTWQERMGSKWQCLVGKQGHSGEAGMLWRSRATLERQCRLNTKHTFLKIKNKTTPKGGHYQNPTATNQVLLCLAEGLELCAHQAEHLFSHHRLLLTAGTQKRPAHLLFRRHVVNWAVVQSNNGVLLAWKKKWAVKPLVNSRLTNISFISFWMRQRVLSV